MNDERLREVFRRLTSETPEPPAFGDLDVHQASPAAARWSQPWVAVVAAAAIALISVGGFGFLGRGSGDLAAPEVTTTSTTTATTTPSVQPDDCPVTIPTDEFIPPEGYDPVRSDGLVWHGTAGLWTALPADGVYTPRKSVWWSANFPGGGEEEPELSVIFELVGPPEAPQGLTINSVHASNAFTDEDGWFIIAGSDPEIRGCWRVTAVYKGASLSYVYYNPYFDDPAASLPDVVGLTVSEAQGVLTEAGYTSSVSLGVEGSFEVCRQDPVGGTQRGDRLNHVKLDGAPSGECHMVPDGLNSDYLTYLDELGRAWYATSCPGADVLVSGGVDAADGLPMIGQTSAERLLRLLESDADPVLPGTLQYAAVPRGGEVWDLDDNGSVSVHRSADFMLAATLADDAPCPLAPTSWNGVPVAFIRSSGADRLCPDEPPLGTAQVMVFFDCGNGVDPNPTGFARPLHPDAPDRITSAFWHLLSGPTINERGRGTGSFFSESDPDALISAELVGDHLIVDFNDGILINNASTSSGSQFFISELFSTAFGNDDVGSVEFRVNGSCEVFWSWLQAGDICNVIDRP